MEGCGWQGAAQDRHAAPVAASGDHRPARTEDRRSGTGGVSLKLPGRCEAAGISCCEFNFCLDYFFSTLLASTHLSTVRHRDEPASEESPGSSVPPSADLTCSSGGLEVEMNIRSKVTGSIIRCICWIAIAALFTTTLYVSGKEVESVLRGDKLQTI